MDDYLKKLVSELGEAINRTINESDAINDTLDRIRATGNKVFLVLEATILFEEPSAKRPAEPLPFSDATAEERFAEISPEDQQFLKSLKISLDGMGEKS